MSRRHRSALSLVPDHNGRHHRDPTVRHDTGVVATLSSHTSQSAPIATTLAGASLPQHDRPMGGAGVSDTLGYNRGSPAAAEVR